MIYRNERRSDAPLLSIVTVVLNNHQGLKKTIESVESQVTEEAEYIVIDGASDDGSCNVALKASAVDVLLSEPDNGIYQAMNKGVTLARGNFIIFLNAGDTLTRGALEILTTSCRTDWDLICHAVNVVSASGTIYKYLPKRPPIRHDPQHMYWPHPGILAKRRVFKLIGGFDESLRFAADLDWANRVIMHKSITVGFSDVPIVNFELGGASSTKLSARETREVAIRHGKRRVFAWWRYLKVCARFTFPARHRPGTEV